MATGDLDVAGGAAAMGKVPATAMVVEAAAEVHEHVNSVLIKHV